MSDMIWEVIFVSCYSVLMQGSVTIDPILNIPIVKPGDDLSNLLVDAVKASAIKLEVDDILCVASKVVSVAENRFIRLDTITPSDEAIRLHERAKSKDPRVLHLILNETGNDTENIRINGNWIGARTKIGRVLTSAGVDKVDENTVLLLPIDPDASAKTIALAIQESFGAQIGVLITDSDGREDIAGATQLSIGTYGVPPIRRQNGTEETICDMLAAAAGLVMGQRGVNIPATIIRGFVYEFTNTAKLSDAN